VLALKNIDSDSLEGLQEARKAISMLIAGMEDLYVELGKLKEENRLLREENNRLKGGSPRPKFNKKSSRSRNISSGGQEKDPPKFSVSEAAVKKKGIETDEEIVVRVDKEILPPGAIFKGYATYEQQDVEIRLVNKLFRFENIGHTIENYWITNANPVKYEHCENRNSYKSLTICSNLVQTTRIWTKR
jgi:regulator of replication initiation timing